LTGRSRSASSRTLLVVVGVLLGALLAPAVASASFEEVQQAYFVIEFFNDARGGPRTGENPEPPVGSGVSFSCGNAGVQVELCSYAPGETPTATLTRGGAVLAQWSEGVANVAPQPGDVVTITSKGHEVASSVYEGAPSIEANCSAGNYSEILEGSAGQNQEGLLRIGAIAGVGVGVANGRWFYNVESGEPQWVGLTEVDLSHVVDHVATFDLRGVNLSACPPKVTTPPSKSSAPVAECDEYWTPPGQVLAISAPGVLENDGDPNGLPLTAHVTKTSFGVKEHPYSINPNTGVLTFGPGPDKTPRKATITYEVTNSAGESSSPTTITIFIQDQRPNGLKSCASASFSSGNPRRTKVCTNLTVSGSESISRDGAEGRLEWGFKSSGNTLCNFDAQEEWTLEGKAFARWKGTPKNVLVGLAETVTFAGHTVDFDGSIGLDGVPGVGISVHATKDSQTTTAVPSKQYSVIDSAGAALVAKTSAPEIAVSITPTIAVGHTTLRLPDATRTAHVCLVAPYKFNPDHYLKHGRC
jgi:hypothetical protein